MFYKHSSLTNLQHTVLVYVHYEICNVNMKFCQKQRYSSSFVTSYTLYCHESKTAYSKCLKKTLTGNQQYLRLLKTNLYILINCKLCSSSKGKQNNMQTKNLRGRTYQFSTHYLML